jgi:spermidine synthase
VDETRESLERREVEGGEICLREVRSTRRLSHYEVVLNGTFLFSTYNSASERALAHLALEPLRGLRTNLRVLVAGLGAGYTLQAVLEYNEIESVLVVEREPAVVEWARAYFSGYNGNALDDERARILVDDFVQFLRTTKETYDAVCVDVDNGPGWLVWEENNPLYGIEGLRHFKRIMADGAVLAFWSSARDDSFEKRLKSVFSPVSIHTIKVTEMDRELDYLIYRAIAPRQSFI